MHWDTGFFCIQNIKKKKEHVALKALTLWSKIRIALQKLNNPAFQYVEQINVQYCMKF